VTPGALERPLEADFPGKRRRADDLVRLRMLLLVIRPGVFLRFHGEVHLNEQHGN